MSWEADYASNVVTFGLLKEDIARTYPNGHFVAIAGGRVVADAPTFDELDTKLEPLGFHHLSVLVERVGRETPPPGAFPGVFTMLTPGRPWRNSETPIAGH